MNISIFLKKSVEVGLLAFLFGYSNLIAIDYNNFRTEENIYLFSYLTLLATFIFGFKPTKFTKQGSTIVLVYIVFWIATFYSVNLHSYLNINQILIYMLIPFFVLINEKVHQNFKIISLALFIGALPLIVNIQSSNTFGLIVALSFIGFMNYASKRGSAFYALAISPVFVYIVFLTGSRTALVAFILSLTIYLLSYMIKKRKSIKSVLINIIIIIIFFTSVLLVVDEIVKLIFSKRSNTSSNFLADRTLFWEGTVKYGVKAWGNGPNFFLNNFRIGDSHNILIEILGVVGLVPLVLFILFLVMLLYTVMVNKLDGKHIILSFFVFYILSGMTENLFMLDNRLITFNSYFIVVLNTLLHGLKFKLKN